MPILLAAAGEILLKKSGILNINLEGRCLPSLCIFITGYYTHNMVLSLLAGIVAGMAGWLLLMGLACITWHAQHVVAGITLNMFALGATSFWYRVAFGVTTAPPTGKCQKRDRNHRNSSPLSKIPVVGEIFFYRIFSSMVR